MTNIIQLNIINICEYNINTSRVVNNMQVIIIKLLS